MTAVLYPIAANAELALARPVARAARAREAQAAAGATVVFTSEATGPAFTTREAALDAYAGRLEDDRPGRGVSLAAEDRCCRLVEQLATDPPAAPVEPVFREGRRWPAPRKPPATHWRLVVSYWRLVPAAEAAAEVAVQVQARLARRRGEAADPQALRALTRQPLQPVKPQQPLDIGLFETRLPESPHIVVPDE